jgi:diguanylate cyclase (GGDEF)-like protein
VTHYIGVHNDITERKLAEDEIRTLAFFDTLTGLPNRRLLMDRMSHAIASSARSKKYVALLFIDLDNFKTLNDTRGHDVGDQLLRQVAVRLSSCVREGDTVARLGGDEFVVMLEDLSPHSQESAAQTEIVGEKVLFTLNQPYEFSDFAYTSTPSIGVTLFVDHAGNHDDLLKRADLAMYQAKAAGRNTLRFFDPEMQAVVTRRAALETGLRDALRLNQFLLHYQAQVDDAGKITGAEVLLRWQHPESGLVSPVHFIPFAEESGLIVPIGQWVLQEACAQLQHWAQQDALAHLTLAVNISTHQIKLPHFVAEVLDTIRRYGVDPARLKLELTESVILDDVEEVIAKMTQLKNNGVRFSLDDFGTGYSSLAYLKRLPLHQVKIDQSFVRDILQDSNDAAIAKMVIALAQTLGLAVIAEGVETTEQRDFLADLGCFAYQGYLYGRPVPIAAFEASVQSLGL